MSLEIRTQGLLLLVLAGAAVSSGCWWRKAKAAPRPAPPPPAVSTAPAKPEPLPPAPKVEPARTVTTLPGPPVAPPSEPSKPEPTTPRRRTRAPAPVPEQAATPEPPEPVPQLVPLLKAEDQEKYKREIDALLRSTEESLARIGDRRLDERQQLDLVRARTFLGQARELRETDLVLALSLAQRASVLAQNVANAIR